MYRLRDIAVALLLMVSLLGPFLLLCLLLAVTQERVLFWQERTGKDENPFWLVKFSTLRDIRSGEREEDNQRQRLTPVGKWLRRFSLDELPQLWNVLVGEMSLVGPRPLLHDYLPLYSSEQLMRFRVRPGITGWAQVKGRNALSFTERFKLDAWYLRHRSFGLDLRILGMTVGKVFRSGDVYVDDRTTAARFNGRN